MKRTLGLLPSLVFCLQTVPELRAPDEVSYILVLLQREKAGPQGKSGIHPTKELSELWRSLL